MNPDFGSVTFHTSLLVTGFSKSVTCVSFTKFFNGSRSANSARLFSVRTSVVRCGIEFARFCWMDVIRFRASSKVCSRGDNGKFEREVMSLSVKSILS